MPPLPPDSDGGAAGAPEEEITYPHTVVTEETKHEGSKTIVTTTTKTTTKEGGKLVTRTTTKTKTKTLTTQEKPDEPAGRPSASTAAGAPDGAAPPAEAKA